MSFELEDESLIASKSNSYLADTGEFPLEFYNDFPPEPVDFMDNIFGFLRSFFNILWWEINFNYSSSTISEILSKFVWLLVVPEFIAKQIFGIIS